MRTHKRFHLGHYRPGDFVVLAERDWVGGWWDPTKYRVISNYASTTGVVVLENQTTDARSEFDHYTRVDVDLCTRL